MKNYGFITPQIQLEDHILGAEITLPILQADGQWDKYLPLYEPQAEKYETFGCTVWGSQNALEILHKKIYDTEPNFAERYNYNISGITPPGADPNKVIQDMRTYGLIDHSEMGTPDTLEEFMTPRPMTEEYLAKGRKWLEEYEIKHKWVLQGYEGKDYRIKAIKEALTVSPICVSVSAWTEVNGIYVDNGTPNNHWTVCFGWTDKGWKIFDSYDHSLKIYSFDSSILFAKSFELLKKNKKQTFREWLKTLFTNFIKYYA